MSTDGNTPIRCWIYRSGKKNEMYLYLDEEGGFERVPETLMNMFGAPALVMELELHPQRPLARENVLQVMDNLRSTGFHLQMPPTVVPEMLHS